MSNEAMHDSQPFHNGQEPAPMKYEILKEKTVGYPFSDSDVEVTEFGFNEAHSSGNLKPYYDAMEEYARLKSQEENKELVEALMALTKEADTIVCNEPEWVIAINLAKFTIQKHTPKG